MCNCGGGARRRAVAAGGRAVRPGRGVPTPRAVAPPPPPAPRLFNGMAITEPAVWGPSLWKILHGLAEYGAGVVSLADWRSLLVALRTSLPCPDCTNHYTRWYQRHSLPRIETVREWLLNLHNDVNRRKRVGIWSTAQLSAHYSALDPVAEKQQMRTALDLLRGVIGETGLTVLVRLVDAVAPVTPTE